MSAKMMSWLRGAKEIIFRPILARLEEKNAYQKSQQISQVLLSMKYKELLAQRALMPRFDDVEFRVFSQNGEDGILLYIFSLIGTTNKKCIEICAADGLQCNTANLIVNHGWNGLMFDGGKTNIKRGWRYYTRRPDTTLWPPKLVHAWVTAENINTLIAENGFTGDIDLLSLDIDGNDYWVWKAIECIRPRVVVLEYNPVLGPDVSVTIPYTSNFRAMSEDNRYTNYFGASLSAFVKLGKQKGYRLVGCERYGYNAFFIHSGIGEEVLPEISPSTCFDHPYAKYAVEVRRPQVVNKEWVLV